MPQDRLRSLTAFLLAVSLAGAAHAQATYATTLTLPDGRDEADYSIAVPLPAGTTATLSGAAFAKTDGTPLPTDVAAEVTSSFASLAGRDPFLFVEVAVGRGASAGALALAVTLDYATAAAPRLTARNGPLEPTASVLATGRIVKLAVDDDGVYAIDEALLRELGLGTDGGPAAVRLYSKGGAMLPERVGDAYPTDLQEVALLSQDDGDGAWDAGERLLFYGEGEDVWSWNPADGGWDRTENLYAERTYYYLAVGGPGLRMARARATEAPAYDDTYTFRARWEDDLANLLKYSQQRQNAGQGSGQPWYGQLMDANRALARPRLWDLGAVPPGGTGRVKSELWAASPTSSRYSVEVGGERLRSESIDTGEWRNANRAIARRGRINAAVALSGGPVDVTVEYPGSPGLQLGWIDYVQLNHDAALAYGDAFARFQSARHAAAGTYGFRLATSRPTVVLDVTDALAPRVQATRPDGGGVVFGYRQAEGTPPREFVAFPAEGDHPRPAVVGEVANSNLHAIPSAEMVIVYGEGLGASAEELAAHRRAHSGLDVVTVPIAEVYEEFGGGRPDPTSVRNFMVMLRGRDAGLRYLLLLGDGHYAPRNIIEDTPSLLPTFQTKLGNWEVNAFPTDDYFALLDEGEGVSGSTTYPTGGLDVGVGRIPATTAAEASAVVEKVVRYDTDPAMRGDWRLRTVYVADDEDTNLHVRDIDDIATKTEARYPQFNQTKIYVDAYEQVTTSGGQRYPAAAEDISRNMFRGNLITTYLGHGGPGGWGLERFLNAPDVERWQAPNALPLLITATCTFTGYDDPTRRVIGEQVLFQRGGGVVASLSTVRPVFTTSNKILTDRSLAVFLDGAKTRALGVGELLNEAKRAEALENDRKYALFGDPALRLAVPQLDVVVTEVDGAPVDPAAAAAEVAPLREVLLRGVVAEASGATAAGFTGKLELTVFDQRRESETLANDPDSRVRTFGQLGATLFTGSATVTDGRWEARFMLPLDVSLSRGEGRISLYATSADGRDGAGVFSRFIVDGLAAPAVTDDTPPVVEVFLGDETFVEGDVTGEDPVLYVRLADDTGINVAGSAIGHDLTATLRGPDEATYVLNDFYEAATDDYRRGEARFPVYDLADGEYALEVRAWDLANNTGLGRTSFLVAADAAAGLRRVLNYPNPMVDATCFQFEHSAAGRLVDVRVDIYSTSGRLVRSLDYAGLAEGPRFGGGDGCLSWDGTDDFGQRLARGVYLYRVRLRADGLDEVAESGFEKLVVVR